MYRLSLLLLLGFLAQNASAQDWRAHLDTLRLASDTIQASSPFDDPINEVYPSEIIEEFQSVMISKLRKLAELNVPIDSITGVDMIEILPIEGTNVSILQWEAKTGGSFQEVYVFTWVESNGQCHFNDIGLSGHTTPVDVLDRNGETIALLYTEVRGCNTCFEGTLSLVNFTDGATTEAQLTIYSRSWEIHITQVQENIYHFRGFLYLDAYVQITNGSEVTYSSQNDPYFEFRYPIIDEDGYERIANGFIEIVDKKEFRLADHIIDEESSEM